MICTERHSHGEVCLCRRTGLSGAPPEERNQSAAVSTVGWDWQWQIKEEDFSLDRSSRQSNWLTC